MAKKSASRSTTLTTRTPSNAKYRLELRLPYMGNASARGASPEGKNGVRPITPSPSQARPSDPSPRLPAQQYPLTAAGSPRATPACPFEVVARLKRRSPSGASPTPAEPSPLPPVIWSLPASAPLDHTHRSPCSSAPRCARPFQFNSPPAVSVRRFLRPAQISTLVRSPVVPQATPPPRTPSPPAAVQREGPSSFGPERRP